MVDDYSASTSTTGAVAVGGSTTSAIETWRDQDWFAVTLEAGKTYRIDLEGRSTGAGSLGDPYLRGVYDADGNLIPGTTNHNGGVGYNSRVEFTPAADGTYYIAAGGAWITRIGTYRLSVTELPAPAPPAEAPADLAADTTTTGAVAVDGWAAGEIGYPSDRDWFAVTLEAGRTYRIDVAGVATGRGTLRYTILHGIRDADGALLPGTRDENSGRGGDPQLTFTASESGTYYVEVGIYWLGAGQASGTYMVLVDDVTDDFTADTDTTGTIEVGGSARGEIETRGDRDWLAVTLEAGKYYWINIEGVSTGEGSLNTPYLRGIYDASGTLIPGTTKHGTGYGVVDPVRVLFTAGESGTYYVEPGSYPDPFFQQTGEGTYKVSVEEIPDDFTAATDTVGTVAVGGSARGEIETDGDRDWFAVTLEAGKSYGIDLEGASTGSGSLRDPYLRGIYDRDGALIPGTTNYGVGRGTGSRVEFTAGETGTYYVEAASHGGRYEGTYTVSVEDITDDFTADTDTTGAVAAGGSARGEIDARGDRDWFAVTLEAGKAYRIDLEGASAGNGSLRAPYLRGIYDGDGTLIPGTANYRGGSGTDSRVEFTPGETGTYYVEAASHGDRYEGTYRVSVEEVPDDVTAPVERPRDDFPANMDTTGRFAATVQARGEIETDGDRDWFAVTLEAGRTYRIDLEGSATHSGSLYNPYILGIHDPDGALIPGTTRYNGGFRHNSRLDFTPDADGTYYVVAGASRRGQGTYTLRVTDLADDFAADTGTTGTVEVEGATRGNIEYAGDRDWFAVTLEAGKTYEIALGILFTPEWGIPKLVHPELLGIYDADGAFIPGTAGVYSGPFLRKVEFAPDATGLYYVEASGAGGNGGHYSIEVDEITDEFTADTGTTGRVEAGGSARGDIDSFGDQDWFAVTLEAGKTYRIDLEGEHSGGGSLWDPNLHGIYDADGTFIPGTANNDRGAGLNSWVAFTPDASGTYYVAAAAHPWRRGTYTLKVTEIPAGDYNADDFTADTGTTGRLAVGGSVTGEIETPGDHDWFEMTLEAGTMYEIDLEGWSTRRGTWWDPYLGGIFDANGARLIIGSGREPRSSLAEGLNEWMEFTPSRDGKYYATVGADWNIYDGTYRISLKEVPRPPSTVTDDFGAHTRTTGRVEVGGSAIGEIETHSDKDWFAVTLEAGKTYRIDVEGGPTGAGSWRDPLLYGIYDANGNRLPGLTSNDNGGVGRNARLEFTPDADGTYYVAVGTNMYGEGTYMVSVADVAVDPPDDFTADTATTGAVAVGGSATGEIDYGFDQDWFAVTLEAGKTYRIDLEGSFTGDGTLLDPYLRGIHSASGTLIAGTLDDDGGTGYNSRRHFTPDADGTYYIAAGSRQSYVGTYKVSVTEELAPEEPVAAPPVIAPPVNEEPVAAPPPDVTADTGTAGTVAVGGSATGEVETAGDRDWFAVTLEAGRTYRIDLEGYQTGRGTLADPYLRGVYDAHGNLISDTPNDDGGEGSNSRMVFTPHEDAVYFVAAGTSGDHVGTFTLSVIDESAAGAPADVAADTTTAHAVAVGGSAAGALETAHDRDWYAVKLEAGTSYRIDIEGWETGGGTLHNPYLRGVYDPDGNLVPGTTDDDGGERYNSRVTFTPDASGTYYISAGAYLSWFGTYKLSVTEAPAVEAPVAAPPVNEAPDDLAADTATAGAVAVGGSVAGEIETAGDRDWFAVTLEAGKTYRIDLEGWETDAVMFPDPYLRGVYDAEGNLVPGTLDDNGGVFLNSRLAFTPDADGTYYISAGAAGSGSGAYTVSVTEEPAPEAPDDFTDDTGTAGAVAVGGSAAGEIETAGDRDWFAVTLEAGTAYRIDLEGWATGLATGWAIDGGTLADPYLRGVYDAEGNLVPGTLDDDDGVFLNSRVAFTPDASGTYYISAGARGSHVGTYTLLVTEEPAVEAPADLAADTTTAGAVAVGGSVAGEVETAGDRDWYAVTLEAGTAYRIDLEGSPTHGGTLSDPYLRGVYDADGNLVPGTPDDNGGQALNSRLAFTPDEAGTYYIEAGAWSTVVGTYTLSVEEGL